MHFKMYMQELKHMENKPVQSQVQNMHSSFITNINQDDLKL